MPLFLLFSAAFFVVPLAEEWSALGFKDSLYFAAMFCALVALEVGFVAASARALRGRARDYYVRAALTALLCVNAAYFFLILLNINNPTRWLFLAILCPVYWLSFASTPFRRFLAVFGLVFIGISAGKAVYAVVSSTEISRAPLDTAQRFASATRNIYVLCFDALASREALRTFYGITDPPHIAALEALDFRVVDTISADEATLTTIGKMFMLGEDFNPRLSRGVFNGLGPTPLYTKLRSRGYRIQFIHEKSLFGLDAGRLDYFYPHSESASSCNFIDQRYGILACRIWFRRLLYDGAGWNFLGISFQPLGDRDEEFDRILERFDAVAGSGERWFSFAHLYFPGHTPAGFRYDESEAADVLVRETRRKMRKLGELFARAVATIKAKDPTAVIVFFGDHGGWLTYGAKPGDRMGGRVLDEATLRLDRRSVLLAVHPAQFCVEPISSRPNTTLVLADLVDCVPGGSTGTRKAN